MINSSNSTCVSTKGKGVAGGGDYKILLNVLGEDDSLSWNDLAGLGDSFMERAKNRLSVADGDIYQLTRYIHSFFVKNNNNFVKNNNNEEIQKKMFKWGDVCAQNAGHAFLDLFKALLQYLDKNNKEVQEKMLEWGDIYIGRVEENVLSPYYIASLLQYLDKSNKEVQEKMLEWGDTCMKCREKLLCNYKNGVKEQSNEYKHKRFLELYGYNIKHYREIIGILLENLDKDNNEVKKKSIEWGGICSNEEEVILEDMEMLALFVSHFDQDYELCAFRLGDICLGSLKPSLLRNEERLLKNVVDYFTRMNRKNKASEIVQDKLLEWGGTCINKAEDKNGLIFVGPFHNLVVKHLDKNNEKVRKKSIKWGDICLEKAEQYRSHQRMFMALVEEGLLDTNDKKVQDDIIKMCGICIKGDADYSGELFIALVRHLDKNNDEVKKRSIEWGDTCLNAENIGNDSLYGKMFMALVEEGLLDKNDEQVQKQMSNMLEILKNIMGHDNVGLNHRKLFVDIVEKWLQGGPSFGFLHNTNQ